MMTRTTAVAAAVASKNLRAAEAEESAANSSATPASSGPALAVDATVEATADDLVDALCRKTAMLHKFNVGTNDTALSDALFDILGETKEDSGERKTNVADDVPQAEV